MSNTLLLNDFYVITTLVSINENTLVANVQLNATHPIFKGHFEQMPVVPGVCQTQMIKEILEEHLGVNLVMMTGDNIKFTGMIVPTQHPNVFVEVNYKAQDDSWLVDSKIYFENTVFTKFKGSFKAK